MACISAETGTLTFAIISLVLHILSSISGIGMLIFWGVAAFRYGFDDSIVSEDRPMERDGAPLYVAISIAHLVSTFVMLFFSLISLLFSSFLMNGILKKKPEHIKVYFIFGVVKMIVTLFIVTAACLSVGRVEALIPLAIIIVIYFFYSLILYMIRYTYLNLEQASGQFSHKPLVEKC